MFAISPVFVAPDLPTISFENTSSALQVRLSVPVDGFFSEDEKLSALLCVRTGDRTTVIYIPLCFTPTLI